MMKHREQEPNLGTTSQGKYKWHAQDENRKSAEKKCELHCRRFESPGRSVNESRT